MPAVLPVSTSVCSSLDGRVGDAGIADDDGVRRLVELHHLGEVDGDIDELAASAPLAAVATTPTIAATISPRAESAEDQIASDTPVHIAATSDGRYAGATHADGAHAACASVLIYPPNEVNNRLTD